MKKVNFLGILSLLFLGLPFSWGEEIPLLQTPTTPVPDNQQLTIRWDWNRPCLIKVGQHPGHLTQQIPQNTTGETTFIPEEKGLRIGLNYARVEEVGNRENHSVLFIICVDARNQPSLSQPGDGVTVSQPSLKFEWNPVGGVPFYHIIVSDLPIELEHRGEEILVKNISVVWQAITSGTSIEYGDLDPSGYFDNTRTPPLISGGEYSWVVLNNYSNTPMFSSPKGARPRNFRVTQFPDALEVAQLTAPANNTTIVYNPQADRIVFEWTRVTGATRYHLLLYVFLGGGTEESSGYEKVWEVFTTDPTVTLSPASEMLSDYEFRWKVLSLDDTGRKKPSCSALWRFNYETETGMLNIYVKDKKDPRPPLARAHVQLKKVPGGAVVLETIADDHGEVKEIKLPVGDYQILVSKQGYQQEKEEKVTIVPNEVINREVLMVRNQGTISGTVVDREGSSLSEAKVKFTSLDLEGIEKTTITDRNGYYSLDLPAPRTWWVEVDKKGYYFEGKKISLSVGENKWENLALTKAQAYLSGYIKSEETGRGIPQAVIKAQSAEEDIFYSAKTNQDGYYTLCLTTGERGVTAWLIWGEANGFISSSPQKILLRSGEERILDEIKLSPGVIVRGWVADAKYYQEHRKEKGIYPAQLSITTPGEKEIKIITGKKGNYETVLKPDTTYQILASAEGYLPDEREIDLGRDTYEQNFYLIPVEPAYYLSGYVTECGEVGESKIKRAKVKIEATVGRFTKTTKTRGGFYAFRKIPGINYKMTVSKKGYLAACGERMISENLSNFNIWLPLKHTPIQYLPSYGNIILNISKVTQQGRPLEKEFRVELKWKVEGGDWQSPSPIIMRPTDEKCEIVITGNTHQVEKGKIIYQLSAVASDLPADVGITTFQQEYVIHVGMVAGNVEIHPAEAILGREAPYEFKVRAYDETGGEIDLAEKIAEGKVRIEWEAESDDLAPDEIRLIVKGETGSVILKGLKKGEITLKAKIEFTEVGEEKEAQAEITIAQADQLKIKVAERHLFDNRISSDQETQFHCYAYVKEQEMRNNLVLWSYEPLLAGRERSKEALESDGLFHPNEEEDFRFIGEITVKAKDKFDPKVEAKPLTICMFTEVTDTTPARRLGNGILELSLPEGCLKEGSRAEIWLKEKPVPPEEKKVGDYIIASSVIFEICNRDFNQAKPITYLTLTIPSHLAGQKDLALGIKKRGKGETAFKKISSKIEGNKVKAEKIYLEGIVEVVLLTLRGELGFEKLKLSPNPFSPEAGGLKISYQLNCPRGMPQITIQIYNILGELIKVVEEDKYCEILTDYTSIWEGKTEDGRLAANGRYIVLLRITDGETTKQQLKPVVLWK